MFIPESPRFLLRHGRTAEALSVLVRIRGSMALAQAELADIELISKEEGAVTWGEVFSKRFRGPLLAGVGLACLSALDGVNAVMRARAIPVA
jgi:Na+/citrate or Na+/malate symporter